MSRILHNIHLIISHPRVCKDAACDQNTSTATKYEVLIVRRVFQYYEYMEHIVYRLVMLRRGVEYWSEDFLRSKLVYDVTILS